MDTQEVQLFLSDVAEVKNEVRNLGDEVARMRKVIHGNGDTSNSLLARTTRVELHLDELRKSLEERVPRVATVRGIPIYWWLIAILLIIVVGLIVLVAASKGLLDANVLATEAAKTGRAVVESQLQPDPQGVP